MPNAGITNSITDIRIDARDSPHQLPASRWAVTSKPSGGLAKRIPSSRLEGTAQAHPGGRLPGIDYGFYTNEQHMGGPPPTGFAYAQPPENSPSCQGGAGARFHFTCRYAGSISNLDVNHSRDQFNPEVELSTRMCFGLPNTSFQWHRFPE